MDEGKSWATNELINPLYGPDPSDETGINTHFRSTFAPRTDSFNSTTPPETTPTKAAAASPTSSTNPFRRSSVGAKFHESTTPTANYPTPPTSASPRQPQFPANLDAAETLQRTDIKRGNSLKQRYPGDTTHKPLEMLRTSTKKAHRAPHLRKGHVTGADSIDRLADPLGQGFHHEGPFDAALKSRNIDLKYSPLAAVTNSNDEALKATPSENIRDAIERHRPLDGVASIPSGGTDRLGRTYGYESGGNLMREEGGDYKIWPAADKPSEEIYAQDRELRTRRKSHSGSSHHLLPRHRDGGEEEGTEMKTRPRNKSVSYATTREVDEVADSSNAGVGPSNTANKGTGGGIMRRLGSLRKRRE